MPVPALQWVKCAFMSVLLYVAAAYGVSLHVTRESEDSELLAAYRKVAKHARALGCILRSRRSMNVRCRVMA